jgi:hypothetical protein
MRYALLALLTLWLSPRCRALYAHIDTEKVPIERILMNLESKLKLQPDSFDLHYQLARVYAMAAFSESEELPVYQSGEYHQGRVRYSEAGGDNGTPVNGGFRAERNQGLKGRDIGKNLSRALRHYEESLRLMRKSGDLDQVRWHVKPVQLGYAWCLDKAGLRTQALEVYRQTFCIAWQTEVEGEFDIGYWKKGGRLELKDLTKDVGMTSDGRTSGARRHHRSLGDGIVFSEECISYMLRILDKHKDATEIGILNQHKGRLATMTRMVTPILIPLSEASFETLVDRDAGVAFDLDGSGLSRHWGWITPKAAWLVFDAKESGQITSGLQMFGNVTFWVFWRDGYQSLGSLDANGDQLLEGEELRGLALWHDANRNGISEPGEVKPLSAHGIDQLSCRSESIGPDLRHSLRGVRFKDGTTRPSYDWFAPMIAPAASK